MTYDGVLSSAAPRPLDAQSATGRRSGVIDAARFVAVLAVILIHSEGAFRTAKGLSPASASASLHLEDLCRFAVPFFFTASGYFFRPSERLAESAIRIVTRIGPLYVFWTAVFFVCDPSAQGYLADPGFLLRLVATGGSAPHLWFLSSLVVDLLLLALLDRLVVLPVAAALGAAAFGFGLVVGCYHPLVLGGTSSEGLIHVARDTPCFGLVFVVLGYWLRTRKVAVGLYAAVLLLVVGAALQLAEMDFVRSLASNDDRTFDYCLSTLLFGAGAFLTAREVSRQVDNLPWLPAFGRSTLGIYAIHELFVVWLAPLLLSDRWSSSFALAAVTLLASLAGVAVLSRVRVLRRMVQ